MLPGVNYTQILNQNMPQGYQTNAPIQAPRQTYVPQVQKPQVSNAQSDVFQLSQQQQYQPQRKPELGLLDEAYKRLGIFQDKLVQTAMKNNPQIAALCAQNGIRGKIEAKNLDDVSNHTKATAKFAVKTGEYMGLDGKDLQTLETAAKFHDIGKALIPREVFAKPGAFNEDERKIMALHSDLGSEILKGLGFEKEVIHVANNHHSGYNLFNANKTGQMANIVKVADIYSALTENRSYKKALSDNEAFEIMGKMVGKGEISPEAFAALKQSIADEKAATLTTNSSATNPFATGTAAAS